MTQYQSFPDAHGDSATLEKLATLRLPPLAGKRFLDVGCNEGFFCGYAQFAGAREVIGLDHSLEFVQRAQQRFPALQFLHQSWETLPAGRFDLILLASALHYAADQEQLLHRLMAALSPGGTLVLELGVLAEGDCGWHEVQRGIDRRRFPTWPKLAEILSPYVWKDMGNSVAQAGDPVPRRVFHVSLRKKVAYLLMQPPGYGKSTICRSLFRPANVRIVENDTCLSHIAQDKIRVDADLRALVRHEFSPFTLDRTMQTLLEAQMLPALVQAWLVEAQFADFALDAYLPEEFHAEVMQILQQEDYMPVKFDWAQAGESVQTPEVSMQMARAYFAELEQGAATAGATSAAAQAAPAMPQPPLPFTGTHGHVDQLVYAYGKLQVLGWAVHDSARMPDFLMLELAGEQHMFANYEKTPRPDVQQHFGLSHPVWGYRLTLAVPAVLRECRPREIASLLQVYGGNREDALDGPFMTDPVHGVQLIG